MWVLGSIHHDLHFFLMIGFNWVGRSKLLSWFSPLWLVTVTLQFPWEQEGRKWSNGRMGMGDYRRGKGERREGLKRKRWGLMVAKKGSTRKKDLNATWSLSPRLNTSSGKGPLYPRASTQQSSVQLFRVLWFLVFNEHIHVCNIYLLYIDLKMI